MYHISVNLAIGRREKIFRGRKKAIRGRQKIVSTFFRHLSFCGGRQKTAGASNGNVTPLGVALFFDTPLVDSSINKVPSFQIYSGATVRISCLFAKVQSINRGSQPKFLWSGGI